MQLTDSRGTAFLISTKSVVYVREWGDGARLLLSRGNQIIDVAETVAEVITASDSVLVAFTSLSGDATGSVAINPLYIVSVSSYSSGTQSQIVLLDDNNNTTRVVMTVSTAFASMDAIIEAGDSGAQPLDADLTTIAGLSPSNDDFLQRKAGAWANRTLTQVRTDLGVLQQVETTGTITGVDPVLVPCFPIPNTNAYSITGSVIFKCTDAGGGTVVVGESRVEAWGILFVNDEAVVDYDGFTATDTSLATSIVDPDSIGSGQLLVSITPPNTADATSEFSYKIRLSGFSL